MDTESALDLVARRLANAKLPEEIERLEAIAGNLERGWTLRRDALRRLTVSAAPRASMQSWRETLYATIADGGTVTAAATETILIPDFSLPGNYLYPGRTLKYTLFGRISSPVTTPGTFTWKLRWGGAAGVSLASSGAIAPDPTASSTNLAWWCEFYMVCRSVGTAGTAFTMGRMWANDIDDGAAAIANLTAALNNQQLAFPDVPAVSASIDTTITKALSPTITNSLSTGSVTCHIAILEALT